MHELSIATAVVEAVTAQADGRRVALVAMRVGRLRQVVPDSLRFYFEIVARDGVADGATLELEDIPLRLRCAGCAHEWEPEWPVFRCPECDTGGVEVIAGEELSVEYIEVDQEEDACIGPR